MFILSIFFHLDIIDFLSSKVVSDFNFLALFEIK